MAWKDANADGVTDAGELIELSKIGIRKNDLKYESENSLANQEHGNYAGEVSTATTSSGSMIIADMYFQYMPAADTMKNQFITEHGNIL